MLRWSRRPCRGRAPIGHCLKYREPALYFVSAGAFAVVSAGGGGVASVVGAPPSADCAAPTALSACALVTCSPPALSIAPTTASLFSASAADAALFISAIESSSPVAALPPPSAFLAPPMPATTFFNLPGPRARGRQLMAPARPVARRAGGAPQKYGVKTVIGAHDRASRAALPHAAPAHAHAHERVHGCRLCVRRGTCALRGGAGAQQGGAGGSQKRALVRCELCAACGWRARARYYILCPAAILSSVRQCVRDSLVQTASKRCGRPLKLGTARCSRAAPRVQGTGGRFWRHRWFALILMRATADLLPRHQFCGAIRWWCCSNCTNAACSGQARAMAWAAARRGACAALSRGGPHTRVLAHCLTYGTHASPVVVGGVPVQPACPRHPPPAPPAPVARQRGQPG